jgi:hypothetical protein
MKRLLAILAGLAMIPTAHDAAAQPRDFAVRVRCESRDFRQEVCRVDQRVIDARLVRQISRARCVQGRSWGWRNDRIWVSEGCAAEFAVRTESRPFPPASGGRDRVFCESRDYRFQRCHTPRLHSVQLVQRHSSAPCREGLTWGWQASGGIWVDNGCAATFRIQRR